MREKICLDGAKNVHFVGIGGISMSGLAEILHQDGFTVSGSDDNASDITARLVSLGIKVDIPNAAENIRQGTELIVYTAAIKPDNPEMQAARRLNIPVIERAAFIGKILKGYDPVCVAGSHGKTTTTSMLAEIAISAGLDPTISIGGLMLGISKGINYRIGNSPCFLLEACEYSNSFHHWHPKIGIILNLDADHLDFFGNFDNLIEAFAKFASNIRPDGCLVIREGIPGFQKITEAANCEIITFGLESDTAPGFESMGKHVDMSTVSAVRRAHFTALNISYDAEKPAFDVMDGENFLARVKLSLPGEYNMLNALACFAAANAMGIAPDVTAAALKNAMGAKRRFEFKGEYNGANIIDDYAHHPTEIAACLAAARRVRPAAITGEQSTGVPVLSKPEGALPAAARRVRPATITGEQSTGVPVLSKPEGVLPATARRVRPAAITGEASASVPVLSKPERALSADTSSRNDEGVPGKIICVFQPHTYTRTKNLLQEFSEAFSDADKIILLPIYAAREPFDPEISSEMLAEKLKSNNKDVISAKNFNEAKNHLQKLIHPGDLVITMGAGDVWKIGENLQP